MFPGIKLDRREGGDKRRRRVVESSGSDQLEALERRLHKTPEFVGHKPTWESTARKKGEDSDLSTREGPMHGIDTCVLHV